MTNQQRLRRLIERTGITLDRAAKIIAEASQRPCSWRSVQAWLCDPALKSARPCPDWAIKTLFSQLDMLGVLHEHDRHLGLPGQDDLQ